MNKPITILRQKLCDMTFREKSDLRSLIIGVAIGFRSGYLFGKRVFLPKDVTFRTNNNGDLVIE